MNDEWSVQDAKSHLSELLRRARSGKPQRIGVRNACIVISEEAWKRGDEPSFGEWLVGSAPRGSPMPLASRKSRRPDPLDASQSRRRT